MKAQLLGSFSIQMAARQAQLSRLLVAHSVLVAHEGSEYTSKAAAEPPRCPLVPVEHFLELLLLRMLPV